MLHFFIASFKLSLSFAASFSSRSPYHSIFFLNLQSVSPFRFMFVLLICQRLLCLLFLCVFIHFSHPHLTLFFCQLRALLLQERLNWPSLDTFTRRKKKERKEKKLKNVGSSRATLWETNYEFYRNMIQAAAAFNNMFVINLIDK